MRKFVAAAAIIASVGVFAMPASSAFAQNNQRPGLENRADDPDVARGWDRHQANPRQDPDVDRGFDRNEREHPDQRPDPDAPPPNTDPNQGGSGVGSPTVHGCNGDGCGYNGPITPNN